MVVVTTAVAGERAGCLVGFHAQSAIDPQRYCVWLSKANHTYRVALRSTHLAVHFLTEDDLEVAEHFGTLTGDDVDKFEGIASSARGRRRTPARAVPAPDGGHAGWRCWTRAATTSASPRECLEAATAGGFSRCGSPQVEHLVPGPRGRRARGPADGLEAGRR